MKQENEILHNIKKQIKQIGLTLDNISDYTDINKRVLKEILKGKRRLKAPTLVSLCYLLQIDFNEIIKGLEYGRN